MWKDGIKPMKSNFAQAVRELTGFGQDEEPRAYEPRFYAPQTPDEFDPEQNDMDMESFHFENMSGPDFGFDVTDDATIVTPNMIIKGNIKSSDDVLIGGEVIGDITTSANIKVDNLVLGNITAINGNIDTGRVKGAINLDGSFNVGPNAIIAGNIKSKDIRVSGKIKGDLDIDGSVFMTSGSLVDGDITSDDFSTEVGSKIVGRIVTRHDDIDFDFESEFDFGGDL